MALLFFWNITNMFANENAKTDIQLWKGFLHKHLSSDQNPGWLGYIGDELLPSFMGIIINHYKDPF